MYPQAKAYTDYRKMIDEMQKDFDCVFVACPDNIHIPAAIRAMRYGKGAFVEKPAAKTVYEARLISDEVKKLKVPTQMGNQGHAGGGIRRRSSGSRPASSARSRKPTPGRAGPGMWPQGMANRPPTKPVPAGLDWDSWIGPAPFRDYHDGLHPFRWRGWYDFGTGAVGDMGCHTFDSVYWSMGMPTVLSVECIKANEPEQRDVPAEGGLPVGVCGHGQEPRLHGVLVRERPEAAGAPGIGGGGQEGTRRVRQPPHRHQGLYRQRG